MINALRAEADRIGPEAAIIRSQADRLERTDIFRDDAWKDGYWISADEIRNLMPLLEIWRSGPIGIEGRLAIAALDLPSDYYPGSDSQVVRHLRDQAAKAEAEGRLATAAGFRAIFRMRNEEAEWTASLMKEADKPLMAPLARLAAAIMPRFDMEFGTVSKIRDSVKIYI